MFANLNELSRVESGQGKRTFGGRVVLVSLVILAGALRLVGQTPVSSITTSLPASALAAALAFTSQPGITVTNTTYSGALISAGVYIPGSTYFSGQPAGLLLTSGGAVDIDPSFPGYVPYPGRQLGQPGDSDLEALILAAGLGVVLTHDAASLVIEFESESAGTLSFLAAFGDQEYGFGLSPYPDVAAVFLNGVQQLFKPSGAPVIATTSDYDLLPPLFVLEAFPLAPEFYGVLGYLSVTIPVPAGSNTLKIAVADANDSNYDCGLFLWGGELLSSGPQFERGDANADGTFNIADAISILSGLFSMGALPCALAADANDDESVNIADAVSVLSALFVTGAPLPPPPISCGADPTSGSLSCASFPPCP